MAGGNGVTVEIDGRKIVLKNLDKVFYPEAGFTKGDVVDYYARVAPALLPHLAGRPLTLKRYPEGVDGPFFYEKRCPRYKPPWFRTEPVWSEGNQEFIHYCVVDDLSSLVWLNGIADLELHTALATAREIDHPTLMVFDLDPGPPADVVACCDVALLLRKLMTALGLDCVAKTSGSKGIQVYVPLNAPGTTYDQTKAFAHAVARLLEQRHPDLVVERMTKSLRGGKVLVDWSQNDRNKTTVCAYSLRAKARPTVSTPLRWVEVERAARTRRGDGLVFEAKDVLARVDRHGDLFAPVLSLRQRLPSADRVAEGGRPAGR
jgi:bifunctional non-homologous end joining protein LigD